MPTEWLETLAQQAAAHCDIPHETLLARLIDHAAEWGIPPETWLIREAVRAGVL